MKITRKYEAGLIIIVALALLQAMLRIVLGLVMTGALGEGAQDTLDEAIEGQVAGWVFGLDTIMFLVLGVSGALFAVGLLTHVPLASYGTIAVSAATIAYDTWAIMAIRPTAALGTVLPMVLITYLLWRRTDFGMTGVSQDARAGGVRD